MKEKCEEQRKIAIDGIEHRVRTADNIILQRKLISPQLKFQRSPKKDMSPNKHQLRGPGSKYVSTSEKTREMEEVMISESKSRVRKVESDEENSDFECFDKFDGKLVHVDVDKEITERDPTRALLPNRSEEDINDNGGTRDGNGNITVRNSNEIFEPPKPRLMTTEEIDSNYDPSEDK